MGFPQKIDVKVRDRILVTTYANETTEGRLRGLILVTILDLLVLLLTSDAAHKICLKLRAPHSTHPSHE